MLGQTGADFEILLVDDGSTDGESGALCDTLAREHPDCIRVLHKPNGGAGDARNAALSLAQGDYVLFLDSDDSYTPEAFAVLAAALDETQTDVLFRSARPATTTARCSPTTCRCMPRTSGDACPAAQPPVSCIAACGAPVHGHGHPLSRPRLGRGSVHDTQDAHGCKVRCDPAGRALPLPAARGLRDQARARRQRRDHGRDRRRADVVSGARSVRAVRKRARQALRGQRAL
ncbi:MAG: glycosyltransferase family 2 protein [Oscillospiraceae bacterium]